MNTPPEAPFLTVLRDQFWVIARNAVIVAVVIVAASFLVHDTFTASSVMLPPDQDSELGSLLSGLAGSPALSRAFGFDATTKTNLYLGVLQSRHVQDKLIEQFQLQKVYKQPDREKTEKMLRAHTAIMTTNEEFIRVSVTEPDPKRAADLANAYVTELDRFLQENSNLNARRRREYLDTRLEDAHATLQKAENQLRDYLVSHRIPAVSTDGAAEAVGDLMAQKASREIELGTLTRISRQANPRAEQLQSELTQIDAQLARIPPATTDAGRLVREVKIQEKILLVLTEEREAARLQEMRNTSTVQVVDAAVPPVHKSAPKRGLLGVGALLIAFAGNAALAWARPARRPA